VFGLNPRDLRKAMKRLGIKMEELRATRVIIELEDGRKMAVDEPQVTIMRAKGQPTMLYVIGEPVEVESQTEEAETPSITEEDVRLVAEQAGVSLEEARKALEEAGGDIAAAILKLQGEA